MNLSSVKEITPVEITGLTGALTGFGHATGILISYIAGYGFPEQPDDKEKFYYIDYVIPLILVIIKIIVLISCFRMEPPLYYLKIN